MIVFVFLAADFLISYMRIRGERAEVRKSIKGRWGGDEVELTRAAVRIERRVGR